MEDLLADVRLQRDEERAVAQLVQEAREDHLVLDEPEPEPVHEHDGRGARLERIPVGDVEQILDPVLHAVAHAAAADEPGAEGAVAERDESVPRERAPGDADGVEGEQDRARGGVGAGGDGGARALLDEREDVFEDGAAGGRERGERGQVGVEDGPVEPLVHFLLADVRPRDLVEPAEKQSAVSETVRARDRKRRRTRFGESCGSRPRGGRRDRAVRRPRRGCPGD